MVAAVIMTAAAVAAGRYAQSHQRPSPARTIDFLPGQEVAQGSPVGGAGPWTYGGQWMFNHTGAPITLNRVVLLGATPGFHVTGISVALARKQNGLIGRGYPPTWAPRVLPVKGTVVPELGLRQIANLDQTAEILIGFTVDKTKKVVGFRAMQIEYTQDSHPHTYILRAAFSVCPRVAPATWHEVGDMCARKGLSPLS